MDMLTGKQIVQTVQTGVEGSQKTVDVTWGDGRASLRGIYKITDGELTICCFYNSKARPTQSDSSDATVMIFRGGAPR